MFRFRLRTLLIAVVAVGLAVWAWTQSEYSVSIYYDDLVIEKAFNYFGTDVTYSPVYTRSLNDIAAAVGITLFVGGCGVATIMHRRNKK